MPHQNIEFSRIAPYVSVGTNLCCGAHAHKLLYAGFRADIDMEYERSQTSLDSRNIPIQLWLPTKDHTSPSLEQLKIGSVALTELVRNKINTYVHCKNGHGRSPTLAAAYFIRQGIGVDAAILAVAKGRKEIHLEPAQYKMLKKFATYCAKSTNN